MMQKVRVQIDAEAVSSHDGVAVLRLKSGFGDPEIMVDLDKVRFVE